jgi:hypothetical protein
MEQACQVGYCDTLFNGTLTPVGKQQPRGFSKTHATSKPRWQLILFPFLVCFPSPFHTGSCYYYCCCDMIPLFLLNTKNIKMLQSVLGSVHHLIKKSHDAKLANGTITTPWKRWIVPSWAHVILGPLTIIIADLTIIQGLQFYYFDFYTANLFDGTPPPAIIRFGYSTVIILGTFFVATYAIGKFLQSKTPEVHTTISQTKE